VLAGLKRHLNLEKLVIIGIPFSSLGVNRNGLFISPSEEKNSVSGV